MRICRSCCSSTPCKFQAVQVNGCGTKTVQGATVQLLSGTTVISSGTTDANGNVSLGFYTSGSYTISATPPGSTRWWSTTPVTLAVTLSCTTTPTTQVLALAPAAGYSCKCSTCRDPLPDAATLTDANGTITLAWSSGAWYGCYTVPGSASNDSNANFQCITGSGAMAIGYKMTCSFTVIESWTSCNSAAPFNPIPGQCASNQAVDTSTNGFKTFNNSSFCAGCSAGASTNNCNTSYTFTMGNAFLNGTVTVSF